MGGKGAGEPTQTDSSRDTFFNCCISWSPGLGKKTISLKYHIDFV